jgi:RPA family protein
LPRVRWSEMAGFSREVARRVFAEELRSSNYSFRDGDDQYQYAPQYLLTPTGARCNRVFLTGTLTERDDIGGDTEYWRGRVVDPTGSVLIYAGQYQPEAASVLAGIEPPAFVAVVGKPSMYQTEDGNVIVSIRAEAIRTVDQKTRNRWIMDAAKRTLERLGDLKRLGPLSLTGEFSTADMAAASPPRDAERAMDHYHTDVEHYRRMVNEALASLKEDLLRLPEAEAAVLEKPALAAAGIRPSPDQNIPGTDKNIPASTRGVKKEEQTAEEEIEEVKIFNFSKRAGARSSKNPKEER